MCPLGGGSDGGGGADRPAILEVSAPERTPLATAVARGGTSGASRVVVGKTTYTAAGTGTYYLRVYSFHNDGAGSYLLDVGVGL